MYSEFCGNSLSVILLIFIPSMPKLIVFVEGKYFIPGWQWRDGKASFLLNGGR